jgi:transcriptional regulator with XRE-family HTH domain
MTQADLARAAGVTRGAVSQIEDGKTKSPSFATGVRIAYALGVEPAELALNRKLKRSEQLAGDQELLQDLERRVQALERKTKPAFAKRQPKG